jgi:hypothetical protein
MRVMIFADQTSTLTVPTTAVWTRETPERRKAVKEFWASRKFGPDQITLFTVGSDMSPEEACVNVLDDVVLHHPKWTSLEQRVPAGTANRHSSAVAPVFAYFNPSRLYSVATT